MCTSCIFSIQYTSSLSAWSVHHQHCMHGVHHISVQSICHHHHSTQKCIITLIVHQNSTQTTESILLNTSLYSSLTTAQHDVYITMLGISQSVYHSTLSKHHHECSIGLHTLLYISQTSHTWVVCVSLFSTELCIPSSDLLGLHFTFYYCKQLRASNTSSLSTQFGTVKLILSCHTSNCLSQWNFHKSVVRTVKLGHPSCHLYKTRDCL